MAGEAVVSAVVGKLSDLLIQEASLLQGVHDEFEWIERELESMRCFLKDADSKNKGDERVRNWVANIRDVSYDAEDAIEAYIFEIAEARSLGGISGMYNELKARYKINKEIQWIKERINDISRRRETYGIENINGAQEGTSSSQRLHEHRRFFAFHEESEIVGQQEERRTLQERLINGKRKRAVISIVGMGGSGEIEKLTEEEMGKKLSDYLSDKRYLVVIDDIWCKEAWEKLNLLLPDRSMKSRVMLTTRNRDVALYADPSVEPRDMRLLSDDESWELFIRKVFPVRLICPPHLEKTGREIVAKCDHLPLAIVVLGGLLLTRDKTLSAWSKVLDSVNWHLAQSSKKCMEILALSYYDLPHYLKPCFLYFGLFPEDSKIKSGRLIRLWIAEGFIQQRGNEALEDVAEDYLEELIRRSMIQVASERSNGTVESCRIHDLLRDLAKSEAEENNFFQIIDKSNAVSSITKKCRRLALYREPDEFVETICCSAPGLRSLFCFNGSFVRLSKLLGEGGKLLRVCETQDENFRTESSPMEKKRFVHIRYLSSIYKHGEIEISPSLFANAKNLQTLELSSAFGLINGGKLPGEFENLEQLRHLRAYNLWIEGHVTFRNLKNIQTLCLTPGSWIEDGLDKLTSLKELEITGNTSSYTNSLSSAIEKLLMLRSLTICSFGVMIPSMSFARHSHIYKMDLTGPMEKLLDWPPNISELKLCNTELQQDDMKKLGMLQYLRNLTLEGRWNCSEKWICPSRGFLQLKYLYVDCSYLSEWIIEEGAMQSLTCVDHLNMRYAKNILPERIRNLLT